jgi:hypothetical protein
MTDTPKSRRRWFKFSLRSLLVFVTICSVGFGWFEYKLRQAHRQRVVVEQIQQLGGMVLYDIQFNSDGNLRNDAKPFGPAWAHQLLGIDFFGNVRIVTSYGFTIPNEGPGTLTHTDKFNDSLLALLQELHQLEDLSLGGTQVTDEGLIHIKMMTGLKKLSLYNTQITDAGLSHLRGATQLESLDLVSTRVTDHGCEELQAALPNLEIKH